MGVQREGHLDFQGETSPETFDQQEFGKAIFFYIAMYRISIIRLIVVHSHP